MLLNLALVGNVRALQQRSARLAQDAPQLEPFAHQIEHLAKTFQMDALRALLQTTQSAMREEEGNANYYHSDRR